MVSRWEKIDWLGASQPAVSLDVVGTGCDVTNPAQYISDSVGPLPEVCADVSAHAPRSINANPLIFIRTSDISPCELPSHSAENNMGFAAAAKSRNTHVRLERSKGG